MGDPSTTWTKGKVTILFATMPGHRYGDREADLSIELLHGVDGVFSLGEVHKGVISDLLHSLHGACSQALVPH